MSRPTLTTGLALELGALTGRATLQDPIVRLDAPANGPAVLTLEEGAVRLDLEFPDRQSVERLYRRIRREALTASSRP